MGIFKITKTESEQFPIGLRYSAPDLEAGEIIESVEVSITPSVEGGLAVYGDPDVDSDMVQQVVRGGKDGEEYTVYFKVTTSAHDIYEDTILVRIRNE